MADELGWKLEEDDEHIIPNPHQPKKTTRIGSRLSPMEKEELAVFLMEKHKVFIWSSSNIPNIDPVIACHKLHVDLAAKPVFQKRQHFTPERVAIIEAEIDKLLEARFIDEVVHAT